MRFILALTHVHVERHIWIGWILSMSSNPLFSWNNVFVSAIARPLPCRETKRRKRLDLAYWPWRFQNGLYIASRNNSNLDVSSYNTSWETELLGAVCKAQSLLGAGHVLGLWQMILEPTWWLFAGPHLCISLAGLEQRREREWEQEYEPKR